MLIEPQKFVAVGTEVEGGDINFFCLGIGGDPLRKADAVWQCGKSLRRLRLDNDFFARPCFAMRRNDQGHECRKNREGFHFRAPFCLKTPLRCYADTSLLKTNEQAASRNQAETKTNLVYFNDGCAVKREKLADAKTETVFWLKEFFDRGYDQLQ